MKTTEDWITGETSLVIEKFSETPPIANDGSRSAPLERQQQDEPSTYGEPALWKERQVGFQLGHHKRQSKQRIRGSFQDTRNLKESRKKDDNKKQGNNKSKPKPESKSKPRSDSESKSKPKPESKSKPKPDSESKSKSKPESESKSVSKSESRSKSKSKPESESKSKSKNESESESKSKGKNNSESESENDSTDEDETFTAPVDSSDSEDVSRDSRSRDNPETSDPTVWSSTWVPTPPNNKDTSTLDSAAQEGATTPPTAGGTSVGTSEETSEGTSGSTSEGTSEATSEVTSEETSGATSEGTSEATSEVSTEGTTEGTSTVTSEETSGETSEGTSGGTSGVSSEETSEGTSQVSSEGTSEGTFEGTTPLSTGGSTSSRLVGFQSDWGPAQTGAMVYDSATNSIYLTGTTFAQITPSTSRSTCFMGSLPIDDIGEWRIKENPVPPRYVGDFILPNYLRSNRGREITGCHVIHYNDESDDALYVGGIAQSENVDSFFNLYQRDQSNSTDWTLTELPIQIQNPTSDAFERAPVRWPVAITNGVAEGLNVIAIVSISSMDAATIGNEYEYKYDDNIMISRTPLLSPSMFGGDLTGNIVQERGSRLYMSLHEYEFTKDKNPVYLRGTDFSTENNSGEIIPTGIGNVQPDKQQYVIVGHLKGIPPEKWNIKEATDHDEQDRLNNFDGFSTTIGVSKDQSFYNEGSSIRFSSIEMDPPLDDFVHGLCLPPMDENRMINSFYVIGSTYGTMHASNVQNEKEIEIIPSGLSAWVSKVDAVEKSIVWTAQLYASNTLSAEGGKTEAFGCHVIDKDPSMLYVGGTVYNGGVMNDSLFSQTSAGSDDIWVAKLSTDTGVLQWIQQIGSAGNDRIAKTNGIESDNDGNAIVYGETTGEMYRTRSTNDIDGEITTDVFVATLDQFSGSSESTNFELNNQIIDNKSKEIKVGGGTVLLIVLLLAIVGFGATFKLRSSRRRGLLDADGEIN